VVQQKENDSSLAVSERKKKGLGVLKLKRDDIEFHPAGPLYSASPASFSFRTSNKVANFAQNQL